LERAGNGTKYGTINFMPWGDGEIITYLLANLFCGVMRALRVLWVTEGALGKGLK